MKKISIFFILILGIIAFFININKLDFVTAEQENYFEISESSDGYNLKKNNQLVEDNIRYENIDLSTILNYISLQEGNIHIDFNNNNDYVNLKDNVLDINFDCKITGKIKSSGETAITLNSNNVIYLNADVMCENYFFTQLQGTIIILGGKYYSKNNFIYSSNSIINISNSTIYNENNKELIISDNSNLNIINSNIYSLNLNNDKLIKFKGSINSNIINNSSNYAFISTTLDLNNNYKYLELNKIFVEYNKDYRIIELENNEIKKQSKLINYSINYNKEFSALEIIDTNKINFIDVLTLKNLDEYTSEFNYIDKYSAEENNGEYKLILPKILNENYVSIGWYQSYDSTTKKLLGENIECLNTNNLEEIVLYTALIDYNSFFTIVNGDLDKYCLYIYMNSKNEYNILENKSFEDCIEFLNKLETNTEISIFLGNYYNNNDPRKQLKLTSNITINNGMFYFYGDIIDSNYQLNNDDYVIKIVDSKVTMNVTFLTSVYNKIFYINPNSVLDIYGGVYYSNKYDFVNYGNLNIKSGIFGLKNEERISEINILNYNNLFTSNVSFYAKNCNIISIADTVNELNLSGNFYSTLESNEYDANIILKNQHNVQIKDCNIFEGTNSISISQTGINSNSFIQISSGNFSGNILNGTIDNFSCVLYLKNQTKNKLIVNKIINFGILRLDGHIDSNTSEEYFVYNYKSLNFYEKICFNKGIFTNTFIDYVDNQKQREILSTLEIYFNFSFNNNCILIKNYNNIENLILKNNYYKFKVYENYLTYEHLLFDTTYDNGYIINGLNPEVNIKDLEIPDYYNDGKNGKDKIISINNSAFENCEINSLILNKYIVRIGKCAFKNSKLKIIDLSKCLELKIIEESAFYNTLINTVEIPRCTLQICENAFNLCVNLNEINLLRFNPDDTNVITNFEITSFDLNDKLKIILSSKSCYDYYNNEKYQLFIKNNILRFKYYLKINHENDLNPLTTTIELIYKNNYTSNLEEIFKNNIYTFDDCYNYEIGYLLDQNNNKIYLTNYEQFIADYSILTIKWILTLKKPIFDFNVNDNYTFLDNLIININFINESYYDKVNYIWYFKSNNENQFKIFSSNEEVNDLLCWDVGNYEIKLEIKVQKDIYYSENFLVKSIIVNPKIENVVWSNNVLTFSGLEIAPNAYIKNDYEILELNVLGKKINVGSNYTAQCEISDKNKNYILQNTTIEYEIKPKKTLVEWSQTELSYNARNQQPIAYYRNLKNEIVYLEISGYAVEIGEYIAEIKDSYDKNYLLTNTSCKFKILKAYVHIIWEDLLQIFDGAEKSPTAYYIFNENRYFFKIPSEINSGKYSKSIILNDEILTHFNFNDEELSAVFTIEELEREVCWENLSIEYCNKYVSPRAYIWSIDNKKIYLNVNSNNKNVGNYNCSVEDNLNNYKLINNSAIYEITPKILKFNWTDSNLTFTGENIHPTIIFSNLLDEEILIYYSNGFRNVSSNPYSVTVFLQSGQDNYILDPSNVSTSFYIHKASLTPVLENNYLEYNGKYQTTKAYVIFPCGTKHYLISNGGGINVNDEGYLINFDLTNDSESINFDIVGDTRLYISKKSCKVYWEELSQTYNGRNLKPKAFIVDINNNVIYLDVLCDAINASNLPYTALAKLVNQNNYILDETSKVSEFFINPMPVNVIWKNTSLTYNGYYQKPNAFILNELNKLIEIDVKGEAKNVSTNNIATAVCNLSNYTISSNEKTNFILNPLVIDIAWGNNKFTYDGNVHYPIATPLTLNNEIVELNYSGQQVNANEEGYWCLVTLKNLNGNYRLNSNSSHCKYYIYKADPVCYIKDLIDGTITITEQELPYSINAYLTGEGKLKIKMNGNDTSNYFVNSDKYYLTLYSEETYNYNKFSMDIILDIKPNYLYYIDNSENRFFEVSSGNGLITNSKLKYRILNNTDSRYTNLIYNFYNSKYEVLRAEKLYLELNKEELKYSSLVKLKFKNGTINPNLKVVLVKDQKINEADFYEYENYYYIDNYLLGSDILLIQEIEHNKLFKLLSLIIPISLSFILIIAVYIKKSVKINLYIKRFLIKIKLYK